LTTARDKAEAVRRLGPLVATLGDRVQRQHYVQQLARLVQVDEQAVTEQIRQAKTARRPAPPAGVESPTAQPEPARGRGPRSLALDEYCLAVALAHPELLERADQVLTESGEAPLQAEDLARAEDRALLTGWRQWLAAGGEADARGGLADSLEAALQARLDSLLQSHEAQPEAPDELLRDKVVEAMLRLRRDNLARRNRDLRFMQEDAREAGDREAQTGYGQTSNALSARIGRLDRAIEARSMMGRRRREDAALRVSLTEE